MGSFQRFRYHAVRYGACTYAEPERATIVRHCHMHVGSPYNAVLLCASAGIQHTHFFDLQYSILVAWFTVFMMEMICYQRHGAFHLSSLECLAGLSCHSLLNTALQLKAPWLHKIQLGIFISHCDFSFKQCLPYETSFLLPLTHNLSW